MYVSGVMGIRAGSGSGRTGPGEAHGAMAITGAGGLIGSALVRRLKAGGHPVLRLVRRTPAAAGEIEWDPGSKDEPIPVLEGIEAVIHLSGEPIAARWTPDRLRRMEASRVGSVQRLAGGISRLSRPPRVFLCASATGYYGSRGDETLDESSPPGHGVLPRLCEKWEAAAAPLAGQGIRVVHMRLGPVLSPAGGFLARMLPVFRLGLGGPLGAGRQILSWIHIEDAVAAAQHVLRKSGIRGPVNFTSPAPVSNADFARALGRALRRPARLRVPAFVLRAIWGAMAGETLLASARVLPRALLDSGFRFRFPRIGPALSDVLGQGI